MFLLEIFGERQIGFLFIEILRFVKVFHQVQFWIGLLLLKYFSLIFLGDSVKWKRQFETKQSIDILGLFLRRGDSRV